jgi:hypothetical protein
MGADLVVAVAAHLAARPEKQRRIALAALASVVNETAETTDCGREQAGEDVRAAVGRLDALGLVATAHHVHGAEIVVLHRRQLRRIAAGEPLAAVAADIERTRPLTVIRISPGRWAAWYQSTLRLPVGAALGLVDGDNAIGRTADEAVAELAARTQAALSPGWVTTG